MQTEFDLHYPSSKIQILGMNPVGFESGNTSITAGRDIPWLQDVDSNNDGETDVWLTAWPYEYRDVVLVDENNEAQEAYNLTNHDLSDAAKYAELKKKFLDIVNYEPSSRWQSPVEPLDVDNSSQISPIDALLVINELGTYEGGTLPETGEVTSFIDTNGDGSIGPLDALLVINQLNVIAAKAASAPVAAPLGSSQLIVAEAPIDGGVGDESFLSPLDGLSMDASEPMWSVADVGQEAADVVKRVARSGRQIETADLNHPLSQMPEHVLDQIFGSLADAF